MKDKTIYILHDIGHTELTPEDAKEHLSDTDLPPSMKKIIEGGIRMSRIDGIRERISHADNNGTRSEAWIEMETEAYRDITYLLSKHEIAEKALTECIKEMESMDALIENDRGVGEWWENDVIIMARNALQQLRS